MKTPPFQVPMYEMPRAKAEEYPKLANGQRVRMRLSESEEWRSGIVIAQGHWEGRLLLGYRVKLDTGEVHLIEYRFVGSLIQRC